MAMYEADDPRSAMAGGNGSETSNAAFGASTYARYYDSEPQETGANFKSWYTRGQNFVVCFSEVSPGATFTRGDQPDEYVLLLHEPDMAATIEANGETMEIEGYSLTIIPPGDSTITVHTAGQVVRLISTQSRDMAEKAENADTYAGPHPQVPAFEPWPKPADGWKIRHYSLDVPDEEGRFGKIFRCTTFMVNVFPPQGPRDIAKLSPHSHDDFEQCSLALHGYYMHHMRWPWIADSREWRDDEHEKVLSPSVAVIPPKVLHTSAPSDPGKNVLVDIFAPPREDFSDMDGWVLNADDYPRK